MHIRSNRITALLAAVMVAAFVTSSLAQSPRLYATTRQVQTLLNRIETRTDQFRSEMQRTVANDNRTTSREERIMDLISDFESATDTMRIRVTSRATLSGEVDDVYRRARQINNFMLRNRANNRAETHWNAIRTDLNTLASYYRLNWTWELDNNFPVGGVSPVPISDSEFRTLANRIEQNTDVFKRQMDNILRRQTRASRDQMTGYIAEFERATNSLSTQFNSRRSTEADVREVLTRGANIDRFMTQNAFARGAESQWQIIRGDLDRLAGYYRVSWNWSDVPTGGGVVAPITDSEFRTLADRIERNTDVFKRQMETILVRQDRARRDEINSYISEFERATNSLSNQFNSRRSTEADVREVLTRGANIDRFMTQNAFARSAENQWRTIRTDLDRLAGYYRVSWNWNELPPTGGWNPAIATIEGTYRLNQGRSDNVSTIVDRALSGMNAAQRESMRRNLERRLASPEMIAFDTSGTSVTMATSNSQRATFEANGVGTTEANPRGRSVTTTATLDRSGLQINYEGDRVNDFHVAFTPVGSDRLTVTRRLYLEGRNEQITVTSQYDRVSGTADWNAVNAGPIWSDNTGAIGDFYIANGTRLTATLNTPIKTRVSQVGDRFTMTVTSPAQYRDALIEGRIVEAASSGRVTGRANLSLAFDTIRMNGRTYSFAGIIDGVRPTNGDSVSVNNEGAIRDSSQTNRTVTRAGIGAVLGAIIGAIAGGGEGAAIGAGVGAGAGAGTVLLGGRDSIELDAGSTFDITASAPANTRVGRY